MKHIYNKKRKENNVVIFFSLIISIFSTLSSFAQETKELKNTFKINLTAGILYKNVLQFGYERVIGKNQSLNIVGGYNEFPSDISLDLSNTQLSGTHKKSGYMFGADYRFYLSKENKYSAPHGVYLAPFVTFYQFSSDRQLTYTDSMGVDYTSKLTTNINFLNIGGQLGYQFVFGKRWVVDAVVFGPAYTHYKFKAKLDGEIPGLDENETAKAVIDALKAKFPLLDQLSSDHEVNSSGVETFWSVGFRYNISIGFRF